MQEFDEEEGEWAPIMFFCEDVDFEVPHEEAIAEWLQSIIKAAKKEIVQVVYVFCSDEFLYEMNVEYLQHDTYTDIITFDSSEEDNQIEGDIFVSIDRVAENAKDLGIPFEQELCRVLAHGVLHLLGQGDKTEEDEKEMRKKEDFWLSKLPVLQ